MRHKRYLLGISLFLIFSIAFTSTTHAALTENTQLRAWPYRQFDSRWASETYAYCGTSSCSCGTTIRSCGCSVTSLSMVLTFWGLGYLYKEGWPLCEIDASKSTNPSNLNTWMLDKNHIGYNTASNVDWLSMKKFYYCGLGPEANKSFWQYMRPYRPCYPSNLTGDCFTPEASETELKKLLDYDLSQGRPDIAKIKRCKKLSDDKKSCTKWGEHFVVIGGYCAKPENSAEVKADYTAYDPGKSYNSTKNTGFVIQKTQDINTQH